MKASDMLLEEFVARNAEDIAYGLAVEASLMIPRSYNWNDQYQNKILPMLGLYLCEMEPAEDTHIEAPEPMGGQLDAWERMWIRTNCIPTLAKTPKLYHWESETLANYSKGHLFSAATTVYQARVNILHYARRFLIENRTYMFTDSYEIVPAYQAEYDAFILSIFNEIAQDPVSESEDKTVFIVGVE